MSIAQRILDIATTLVACAVFAACVYLLTATGTLQGVEGAGAIPYVALGVVAYPWFRGAVRRDREHASLDVWE